MTLSTLPVLVAALFGGLWFLLGRLARTGVLPRREAAWLYALLLALLAWGGLNASLAGTGRYGGEAFFALLPGYWMPYVPVVLGVTGALLVRPLRAGLSTLVAQTPAHWLTGVHAVRILALGSLIKAHMGVFPERFALYVAIPDLLFGLSALPVTAWARRGSLARPALLAWHLTGAAVIVVPVAGLMHVFMAEPRFDALFAFPMVLAPTLAVPTLVMLNLLVAWRLLAPTAGGAGEGAAMGPTGGSMPTGRPAGRREAPCGPHAIPV
jgi:hypothetical protein